MPEPRQLSPPLRPPRPLPPENETAKQRDSQPSPRNRRTREVFEEQASWILETALSIGRKSGLTEADARDFTGWVAWRMIRRDFAVLRACRDPLRLQGYLHKVICNLAKDYRNHLWGKWRPTKTAQRLGAYAIELERLCTRDGFSMREAIRFLRCNRPYSPDTEVLEELAGRLPIRLRHTQMELEMALHGGSVVVEQDPVAFDSQRLRRSVRVGLSTAWAALEARDRELLTLIFEDGKSVASIARERGIDQRALYSHRDRCLGDLRRLLVEQGLAWSDVAVALMSATGSPPDSDA
ncbi:MAG: hypothetical protein MPN21_22675 [Thermoanaerobaculia bacterium]|nr:hypothetical protein [Thermoanaerobaculia bacterium]